MATCCTFKRLENGHDVFLRGKKIGRILFSKESNGRFCYMLGCDQSRIPRTYRTKQKAVDALVNIHKLVTEAKKKRMPLQEVIVRAWADKPNTVEQEWEAKTRKMKKTRKRKAK